MRTAIVVEFRKAAASRTLWVTSVLVAFGIPLLAGALSAAARAGNEQILAQLGPLGGASHWELLTGITSQVSAAGALLAFGVGLSWLFGREFADNTVTGVFAQPITRGSIALAKLCVFLLWAAATACALVAATSAAGFALGFPLGEGAFADQVRLFALLVSTAALATPAAWAATLGRGLLPGIAITILILITAQIVAIAAPQAAAWMPLAAPALWALFPGSVHPGQLALVLVVPVIFSAATALAWQRLQLDR